MWFEIFEFLKCLIYRKVCCLNCVQSRFRDEHSFIFFPPRLDKSQRVVITIVPNTNKLFWITISRYFLFFLILDFYHKNNHNRSVFLRFEPILHSLQLIMFADWFPRLKDASFDCEINWYSKKVDFEKKNKCFFHKCLFFFFNSPCAFRFNVFRGYVNAAEEIRFLWIFFSFSPTNRVQHKRPSTVHHAAISIWTEDTRVPETIEFDIRSVEPPCNPGFRAKKYGFRSEFRRRTNIKIGRHARARPQGHDR